VERIGPVVNEYGVGFETERVEGEGECVDEAVELAEGGSLVDEGRIEWGFG
jgi:hypothetical protein